MFFNVESALEAREKVNFASLYYGKNLVFFKSYGGKDFGYTLPHRFMAITKRRLLLSLAVFGDFFVGVDDGEKFVLDGRNCAEALDTIDERDESLQMVDCPNSSTPFHDSFVWPPPRDWDISRFEQRTFAGVVIKTSDKFFVPIDIENTFMRIYDQRGCCVDSYLRNFPSENFLDVLLATESVDEPGDDDDLWDDVDEEAVTFYQDGPLPSYGFVIGSVSPADLVIDDIKINKVHVGWGVRDYSIGHWYS